MALGGTVLRSNKDAFIRAVVVIYVSISDVLDHLIAATRVHTVRIGTNNGIPVRLEMDFSARMSEAEQTAGDDWDRVEIVVYSRKV